MTEFANRVLSIAATQVGVREHGRNTGPEIAGYCRDIGWPVNGIKGTGPDSWCAIFVSAMAARAAAQMGIKPPFHLTGGVYTLDEQAPAACKTQVPTPGSIFILHDHKHTGFVQSIENGRLWTIEGNTDPAGAHDGDGVYGPPDRWRDPSEIMLYLDMSAMPTSVRTTGDVPLSS